MRINFASENRGRGLCHWLRLSNNLTQFIMRIDTTLLDSITAEAVQSPRLRMSRDMRNSPADQSQRMLNALEPGTVVDIHRHQASSEICIVLRGEAEEIFYDENGNETERVRMKPASDCSAVCIEKGRWHRLISLAPGTVIFECKDGSYQPASPSDILQPNKSE